MSDASCVSALSLLPENIGRESLLQAVVPFTMVARKRLEFLYDSAETIDQERIPGNIVQCGVCNGGSAAVAGHRVRERHLFDRKLFLFDSFKGLPPASEADGVRAQSFTGQCSGNQQSVELALRIANIDRSHVEIFPGWFAETFPHARTGQIALLVIDADWYDSVKLVLHTFYDAVAPGGIIYIDDYGYWEGCRKATDEFFAERHIEVPLLAIDDTGHAFRKPPRPTTYT